MNTQSSQRDLLLYLVLHAVLWGFIGYGQGMWSVANRVLTDTEKRIRDYPSEKEWSDAVKKDMVFEGMYSRGVVLALLGASFGTIVAATSFKLPPKNVFGVSVATITLGVAWWLNITLGLYGGWRLHHFGAAGFVMGFLILSAKFTPIVAGALLGLALGVTRRLVLEQVPASRFRLPIGIIIGGALATLIISAINLALDDIPAIVWELGGLHSFLALAFAFGAIAGARIAAIPVIPIHLQSAQQAAQPDREQAGEFGQS